MEARRATVVSRKNTVVATKIVKAYLAGQVGAHRVPGDALDVGGVPLQHLDLRAGRAVPYDDLQAGCRVSVDSCMQASLQPYAHSLSTSLFERSLACSLSIPLAPAAVS